MTRWELKFDLISLHVLLPILSRFWPEFGQNGKGDVKVEDVLRHEAGLPFFQQTIMQADLVRQPEQTKAAFSYNIPGVQGNDTVLIYGSPL